MKALDNFKKLFVINGFSKSDLDFILETDYFDKVEFVDNETLKIYRTLALPKKMANEFIKLKHQNIGEYWTLDKEFASAVWGDGQYDEDTYDTMCVGHLKIKDIDWEMMKYAFDDDIYHFTEEYEIRGKKGGATIKVVKCELVEDERNEMKEGGSIKSKGTFTSLGTAKELGITPKIDGHDMIAKCDCGEKFSYQNSNKNILWQCPECNGMKRIDENKMANGGVIKKLEDEGIDNEIVYSFTFNDCYIVFSDERPNGFNQINLQRIDVDDKGKGTGTLCMNTFIEYIKTNFNVDGIMLNPETLRNQLFYKRFGFEMNEEDLMFLTF